MQRYKQFGISTHYKHIRQPSYDARAKYRGVSLPTLRFGWSAAWLPSVVVLFDLTPVHENMLLPTG